MPWALAQEAGTKTMLSSRECHGEEAIGPAMQVLPTVLQPGHLHLYSQAEGSRRGGWGCPQADAPGEKHLEAISSLPASASGCRDVFSRVVSSWALYTVLQSPSCFRENTLALFYGVLYSNVHKSLQLAITVDFIPPYLVVLGLTTSELGQSSVGTWKLDSGA